MKKIPDYISLELNRNNNYLAHFKTNDYRVLFTPKNFSYDIKEKFSQYDSVLKEQQPTKKASCNKTLTIYLVLTDKCNLQCRYCDVLGNDDHRKMNSFMDWDIAKTAIDTLEDRIKKKPYLKTQIVFFGGETLLNWPILAKICDELVKRNLTQNTEKMLVTNGILIDEEKAKFLKLHNVYTVVSLDGRAKSNDKMRCYYNGRGSFNDTARGLFILKKVMPGCYGISCTLGIHNAETLVEEISYLQNTFEPCCTGINVFHYQPDGNCPIKIDDQTICNALLNSFKVARKQGIAIYQFANIIKAFVDHKRNVDYCPACTNKLLFSPKGRVGRCETLMNNKNFSIPLEEFINSGMPSHLDWTGYTPEHQDDCLQCTSRWICPGSCPYDQFISTGNLHGVEPRRCNFHRQFLVELLDLTLDNYLTRNNQQQDTDLFIPNQSDFDSVAGDIPLNFAPHTIFITGVGAMTEDKI